MSSTTLDQGERFDRIDKQLDGIATAVVKGFGRIDKVLGKRQAMLTYGEFLVS